MNAKTQIPKGVILFFTLLSCYLLNIQLTSAQRVDSNSQERKAHHFTAVKQGSQDGYDPASPWVLWYWMDASVSKEGIRSDLIAMKQQGIAGAYLVSVNGRPDSLLVDPPVVQLSPLWWDMIKETFHVADSLGLKLGVHVGDGFATSGGPWIDPANSMQRVVWSDTVVNAFSDGAALHLQLPLSKDIKEGYYKDIALYALPVGTNKSTDNIIPTLTTDVPDQDPSILIDPSNQKNFSSKTSCYIDYTFKEPFTARTVDITTHGTTFQAKRLSIWISKDGKQYSFYTQLKPTRSGWQDYTYPVHYSIPAVTARYFRFVYDPEGTEPGSEDLDNAKWSPSLKLSGLRLATDARLPDYDGKSGAVWRVSKRADQQLIPDSLCIQPAQIINLTDFMQPDGSIIWKAPKGKWRLLRMGHSSTGATNATAGGGKGLEADKFNVEAVKLQYDNWFGKIAGQISKQQAARVLKVFYMDSWEGGSQNWSPVFRAAFKQKRGYDLLPYLPVMAGYPIGSAEMSEKILYDIRLTIADLLQQNYYGTLTSMAHALGYKVAVECTAPVMVADGLRHFEKVDFPMGEFWLRSPTHDKPNDILDAVSGGHIYGKNIIQAEAFTELRNKWDEYPGMLKTLQDHHYAIGINRLVFHVFGENPWLDRAPGMTLGGIGLYFQRDQTWWPMAKGWMDYTRRSQYLLQQGAPVTDIAVYNGGEIPSRAITPDRLLSTLPGLFGEKRIASENKRLANKGNPLQHIPEKVTSSAGITTAKDWIDPLHGYKYDAVNSDALLRLATVSNGEVVLPGGARYELLVLPRLEKMDPNNAFISTQLAKKLLALTRAGATLLVDRYPQYERGLQAGEDQQVASIMDTLLGGITQYKALEKSGGSRAVGNGRVVYGPYKGADLRQLGIEKDFQAMGVDGSPVEELAWTHRHINHATAQQRVAFTQHTDQEALAGLALTDIYFVSNQQPNTRKLHVRMRVGDKKPLLYDAVSGLLSAPIEWSTTDKSTQVNLSLPANGSIFIVLTDKTTKANSFAQPVLTSPQIEVPLPELSGLWQVQFDHKKGGPAAPIELKTLKDWTLFASDSIKYFSGIASYQIDFNWEDKKGLLLKWLDLGSVDNIASVNLNGIDCGVAWTAPYRVDISKALQSGRNHLEIKVANTWSNRLIGDHALPKEKRQTWTKAPFAPNLEGRDLLPAGLKGPVKLIGIKN